VICVWRHDSTWRCIGSKLRWMRSTPTESVSTRLKLLVCFAKTGVKFPATAMFGRMYTQSPHSLPQHEPLVPAQGLNRGEMRSSIVEKTAFLLRLLKIAVTEILMGAPIGCPNRWIANRG